MTSDPVNHPAHYTAGAVECIDAIEAAMTFEEFVGFLRGQMIKYVWRLGRKGDGLEDVEKALWYGRRLADKLDEMKAVAEEDDAFIASLSDAKPASRWLDLSDMAASAQRAEASGEYRAISEMLEAAREGRDREAIAAKEAELRKLSHLEDTDGNVVLMYTDHVNWDEAPPWANFLAYDDRAPEDGERNYRAYWFETRPEWLPARGYWRSGGQGGKLQYAEPYSGQGGDPRLFVRASG